MDAVYHANAHVLLQGEPAFRFHHAADRCLSVQLMDADKLDTPPGEGPAVRRSLARLASPRPPSLATPPAG